MSTTPSTPIGLDLFRRQSSSKHPMPASHAPLLPQPNAASSGRTPQHSMTSAAGAKTAQNAQRNGSVEKRTGDRKSLTGSDYGDKNPFAIDSELNENPAAGHSYGTIGNQTRQNLTDGSKISLLDDENEQKFEKFSVRRLSKQKLWTLILLLLCAFLWSVVFACIGPFFPTEALAKGASHTEVGAIFGIFELAVMLFSPLWGRLVPVVGPRRLFLFGIFTTGAANILYGALDWSPPGKTFVILCFILRVAEGIGAAAYMTGTFPILAHQFSDNISAVLGLESTCVSLGFMIGPLIGSIFYTIGGFYLPFFVLGTAALVGGVAGACLLPNIVYEDSDDDDENTEEAKKAGVFKIMRIPLISLVLLCKIITNAGIAFFDAMLAPHLSSKFGLTEIFIGVWFLLTGIFEAGSAPFLGFILDRKPWHIHSMFFGALIATVGYLLVGPSPLLPFLPAIIPISIAAQLFIGLAVSLIFLPPSSLLLITCQQHNLPESAALHGAVGGLITFTESFGCFLGPTIGGYLVEKFSFEWTSTLIAALFLLTAVLLFGPLCARICSRKPKSAKIDLSQN